MPPIFGILAPIISKVLDFIPDAQKKAEAQLKIQQELDANSQAILAALAQVDKAQADVDKQEASSSNLFISGWRPFCGWVCASAFAWAFVVQPVLTFVLAEFHHFVVLPTLDMSQLMPVLLGMLGLGGMRTWEKSQGCQNNH